MFKLTIDPNNKFNRPDHFLLEACGFIPGWVAEWADSDSAKSLKDHLDDTYGFGLYQFDQGSINEQGTYSYPQDEDLDPLIKIETDEGDFYMYQYAIVAIPTPTGPFICRMD